jgi:hypothetical protein
MQKIAAAAVKEGLTHKDLRFMAGIGDSGKNPGKCRGQLYNALKTPKLKPAVTTIELPFKPGFNRPVIRQKDHSFRSVAIISICNLCSLTTFSI